MNRFEHFCHRMDTETLKSLPQVQSSHQNITAVNLKCTIYSFYSSNVRLNRLEFILKGTLFTLNLQ